MLKWNIRNQILGSGFMSLVLLVGLVAYFYVFTSGEFRRNSEELISQTADRHAEDVSRLLAQQSSTYDDWVREDVVGLAIEFNTTSELASQMNEWLANEPGFALLALVDRDGRVLEAAVQDGSVSAIKGSILPELSKLKNRSGRTVGYVESESLAQLGRKHTSSFVFYKPSTTSSGDPNGAFVAFTNWAALVDQVESCTEQIEKLGYREGLTALAFTDNGTISAEAARLSDDGHNINRSDLLTDIRQSGTGDIALYENDGYPLFVASRSLGAVTSGKSSAEAPVLICAVPEDAVMSQLKGQLYLILAIGVLASLMVLGLNYYLASRISRRVTRVADIASAMAEGDVDHEITIRSSDEIGSLADSFRALITYQKELGGVAERLSNNDLTVQVKPKSDRDLLGNAFKTMTDNLAAVIRKLAENASELTSAATEIASSSEEMSRGAGDQSRQTEEIQQSVEAVAASILQAASNAAEATKVSENASQTAGDGGTVVSETIGGMQRIADVVRNSAGSIAKLASSADQIGEIISVIDDIADQTNLLALNAAIEAARAGEQGRGFAVVADEVRKLAERTGKATGEIGQMIKGIQSETEDAVNAMEAGVQEVDKGRELADRAGTSLHEIVNLSENVNRMIREIALAAQEQQTATEQITANIEHIAGVTRETASGAKQSASAAESLNRQAEELQKIVAQFQVS